MAKRVLDRLSDIFKSNVNDLLDRMEDPEKMVRQVIRDMEVAVDQTVEGVSKAVANQRRLEKQEEQTRADIVGWQAKAEKAVETGDEKYARLALAKKIELTRMAEEISPALEESRQTIERLRTQLAEMRERLQEARRREGELVARCRTARSARGESEGGITDESDPFARFARIERQVKGHEADFTRFEQKVDATAAEADLYREMAETRQAERELQEMDRAKKVEEELAALRSRVAGDKVADNS